MTPRRIVVIGAGLAGGNVAVGLRAEGFDGEVFIFGDEPGVPYGRPPLSKTYLRDEEDLSGWLVKPADWYEQHDITLSAEEPVERIDPSGASVVLADGTEFPCDAVCLATGARPRSIRGKGADLDGIHTLRRKADADAIKSAAKPGSRCVVVGMNFIGAEVAASLRQRGVEVTAVFPGPHPLAAVLGEDAGRVISGIHTDHGVELVPNERVDTFLGSHRVEEVRTESGRSFDCDFCVVGVGVEPNTEIAERSGLAVDNGIVVDASCRTRIPTVYAAGDVANHDHPLFGRVRVEHYNNAEKQGRHVARVMLDKAGAYDYMHSFWSDQYDDKIEYVGHTKDWDEFIVRGDLEQRAFVGLYLKDGRLQAAMGLNRGGDPEAEPDSELAGLVELIKTGAPIVAT